MSRRDEEPIVVAEFAATAAAEAAWSSLVEAGIPATVVTEAPPWGTLSNRVMCERRHAGAAIEVLRVGAERQADE